MTSVERAMLFFAFGYACGSFLMYLLGLILT
jgi:hypothetical protein